jgi:hypothetical protein
VKRIERPSPGLLARLGVPVGGRVRKLRAGEVQRPHPLKCRIRASLDGALLESRSTAAVEPIMGVVPRGRNELVPSATRSLLDL